MNGNHLTIVMYHYVRDLKNSRYPTIKGCDIRDFKEQLDFLGRHYNFVTMEEVIAAYREGASLPPHPVLLTFDDAYKDHFEYVFPLLDHRHIQGCFFPPVKAVTEHTVLDVNKIHFILASTPEDRFDTLLGEIRLQMDRNREEFSLEPFEHYYEKLAKPSRFDRAEVIFVKRLLQVELDESLRHRIADSIFEKVVGIDEDAFSRELYMSVGQIRCMVGCGMHVGSHGYDHYWLSSLPRERQEFEIGKSIGFIRDVGGDPENWTMCYPFGDYNDATIGLLRERGCRLGLTTRVDLADLDDRSPDAVFKLPRLDVNDLPKKADAIVNDWYR